MKENNTQSEDLKKFIRDVSAQRLKIMSLATFWALLSKLAIHVADKKVNQCL